MDTVDYFKIMLFVMGFYSVSITLLSYSIPTENIDYVTSFSDLGDSISLKGMSEKVQDSMTKQSNIPVIELGSLVFFSGNILIDLLLNFTFAMPQMVTLLVNGITNLFNFDVVLMGTLQAFISTIMIIFYFVGLIQLLTNVRSGRAI